MDYRPDEAVATGAHNSAGWGESLRRGPSICGAGLRCRYMLGPETLPLAADASRSPSPTRPLGLARPQTASLKIIFFLIITRQAIRRGSFTSVSDLITAIETFTDGWNERCHPFTWTKTPDQLLPRCKPGKRTSFTRH